MHIVWCTHWKKSVTWNHLYLWPRFYFCHTQVIIGNALRLSRNSHWTSRQTISFVDFNPYNFLLVRICLLSLINYLIRPCNRIRFCLCWFSKSRIEYRELLFADVRIMHETLCTTWNKRKSSKNIGQRVQKRNRSTSNNFALLMLVWFQCILSLS